MGGSNITPSNSGEIYSTTETAIGTWVDGSTLYRKVFTNVSNGTNIGMTSSTINFLRLRGFGYDTVTPSHIIELPWDANYGMYLYKTTGIITITGPIGVDYIVIEYTKT